MKKITPSALALALATLFAGAAMLFAVHLHLSLYAIAGEGVVFVIGTIFTVRAFQK